jgi:guanosine-3',5'-bis(diphosphate) 3'-pyrophosphohydrolase
MPETPKVEDIFSAFPQKMNISEGDKNWITKAFNFAEKSHEGQKRASGEPYFNHVFEVAKTLAKLGMDAKTVVAGILHDTIEDTEATEEQI